MTGTIVTTTSGAAVAFSSDNPDLRASSLYFYNLTAGNSVLVDIANHVGRVYRLPDPTVDAAVVPEPRRHAGLLGGRQHRGRLGEPVLPGEPLALLRGPLAEAA